MSLAARSTAQERMDTDCADYDDYRRCLRDLTRVNAVTLTHRAMLQWLARESAGRSTFSLLDVACGHGDALRAVHHWKQYLKLDNTGQWAEIARRQLDRLRQATLIHTR